VANSPQARKRAKQAEERRQHNVEFRSEFRTHLKRVSYAIEAGKKEDAEAAYKVALPVIDALVGKGLIHKNKAARHKSRLNKRIKAIAA
jgi:small subunit ribosomal protein S20